MKHSSKLKRPIIVGHANSFHDSSIAIITDDKIYAESFERHTQCKMSTANFLMQYSWRSVKAALKNMGLSRPEDVNVIMLSSWDAGDFSLLFPEDAEIGGMLNETGFGNSLYDWLQLSAMLCEPLFRTQLAWLLRDGRPRLDTYPATDEQVFGAYPERNISWQAKTVDHHLAHASNAVYTSPFDECVVLVADGAGEGHSTSIYHFASNDFKLLFRSGSFLSLGNLYSRLTSLCGFDTMEGEEWKVMGLAAYGRPRADIYGFFQSKGDGYGKSEGEPIAYEDFHELEQMVGKFRHHSNEDLMQAADLAHNFQRYFEEKIIELADFASKLNLSKNLAYAGGCALNSAANGQILAKTGFQRLHIPSAPADDGNSLGVALYEKYHVLKEKRDNKIMTPYLGSAVDVRKLESILAFKGINYHKAASKSHLCAEAADMLAEGKIIGWMQGRAEFGPRALGNRSIIADPRSPEMKDKINSRVKFREWYRPLAPSILHDSGEEYFEDYQESPYMERTLRFRPEMRARVPAVVHQDGTGRLQSVKEESNPLFYNLIHAFYKRTGIPLLLNTSLNVMGKPIIHSVEDAITVFYTTGLDCLVIEDYVLTK
jgi:carbamoyltransferase